MSKIEVLSPLVGTITPEHAEARAAHWAKVRALAEPHRQALILRLLDTWEQANCAYYDGAMLWPYILLAEPMAPNVYGSCGPMTAWGEKATQIRIRPSLLVGTHPHTKRGNHNAEGLHRLVADVLIHEQIHQWQQEITGNREEAYHGHGPDFCRKANEIGSAFDLAPVIPKNRKAERQPLGANWPHNVRPASFYLGAYVPASGDNGNQEARARCAMQELRRWHLAHAADRMQGQFAALEPVFAAIDQVVGQSESEASHG